MNMNNGVKRWEVNAFVRPSVDFSPFHSIVYVHISICTSTLPTQRTTFIIHVYLSSWHHKQQSFSPKLTLSWSFLGCFIDNQHKVFFPTTKRHHIAVLVFKYRILGEPQSSETRLLIWPAVVIDMNHNRHRDDGSCGHHFLHEKLWPVWKGQVCRCAGS